MREFTPSASIECNAHHIWIWTESECVLWRPDFAAGVANFERGVAMDVLGEGVISALARSREVDSDDLHLLTEGMSLLDRVRLWEKEEMAVLGYKTLRSMYKDMMKVFVERRNALTVFIPTRHDKIQAWEGFAKDDIEHANVAVDSEASVDEIGKAALLAISRCA